MDDKLTGPLYTSWFTHFRKRQQSIGLIVEQVIQCIRSLTIMFKDESINLFSVF